ncbi:hypothetical protein RchiOBHm_Chr2g0155031 [Rosa chinensis]|uniref:Uncharacterized protein n=1 Tax=Rosa chinensis TaxID=74649 RepID=A0A2P6S154_ROSCH|nr:hypothetical protein RchiOBHm_Chr2g0155031 [Rosa chinensis]
MRGKVLLLHGGGLKKRSAHSLTLCRGRTQKRKEKQSKCSSSLFFHHRPSNDTGQPPVDSPQPCEATCSSLGSRLSRERRRRDRVRTARFGSKNGDSSYRPRNLPKLHPQVRLDLLKLPEPPFHGGAASGSGWNLNPVAPETFDQKGSRPEVAVFTSN